MCRYSVSVTKPRRTPRDSCIHFESKDGTPDCPYFSRFPCKPGTLFWHSLFTHRPRFEDAKAAIEKLLCFSFIDTFLFDGAQSYSLLRWGGRVVVSEDVSPESALDSFDLSDSVEPAAVRKRVMADSENRSITTAIPASSLPSILRKVSELEELVCIQPFCKLRKASMKARVLRVFYSASGSKPYGYVITNTHTPSSMSARVTGIEMTDQFCASTENAVSVFKISGKSVSPAAKIAKDVFAFVENYFTLRLTEIVVDFLGPADDLKVVQIKAFSVKPFVSPLRQLALTGEKYSRRGSVTTTANAVWRAPKLRTADALSHKQVCFSCRMKKVELTKLVTCKMVTECVKSLHARGVDVLPVPRPKPGFQKCCDICYSIIVNEQELEKLTHKNSKILVSRSLFVPSGESGGSVCYRLLIAVSKLEDTPLGLASVLEAVEISVATVGCVIFSVKEERIGNFRVLNLFSATAVGDVSVAVKGRDGTVVGSGTMSVLERLVGQCQYSNSAVVSLPCFLGHAQWRVHLSLGVQRVTGVSVLHTPLPDDWLPLIVGLRSGRRRGRSRSRSLPRV